MELDLDYKEGLDYRKVFEHKYNRDAWLQLLHDVFLSKAEFNRNPAEVHVSSQLAKKAFYLGRIRLSSGEQIAIYEVELSESVDIAHNRRGIRDMLTTNWRGDYTGAFVLSYRKNESVLRFSYVSETWGFNEKGEYRKETTDTKRFTYLLGEGQGCRTAAEQFQKLRESKQSLADVFLAFSVEALTEQFYRDLFGWYSWATETVKFWASDKDTIETKVIRMITRIMFVWFIKQKNFVPENLFDPQYISSVLKDFDPQSEESGTYYNAILQNLFFATLNCAVGERRFVRESDTKMDIKTLYRYQGMFSISPDEALKLFSKIPFLNGGLFECLDKTKTLDGKTAHYYDGFSRNANIRAFVPNVLFFDPQKGLIPILGRYNFTVEENSHNDMQVALDPELLGKVFENLLATYNPETAETARNQTGSFYTPREIVSYMADQSLINFLGDTPEVRKLFSDSDLDDNDRSSLQPIAKKLKQVKIFDPACGSGAFPVCLLTRITELLQRINPQKNPYDLKLSIIKNCLYGSDIQCIATQITKLRFFISLICDQGSIDSREPELNFGVNPLPNLETKFVAANSLIRIEKQGSGDLFDNEIDKLKEELRDVRSKHFTARSRAEKIKLREEDKELRDKLKKELLRGDGYLASKTDADNLANWNPYDQNSVAPFFDPEWMFGVPEGFDIVIGNPPYIQLQNDNGKLAKEYENCGYETFARTGDIYCLFYERGWQLLKDGGHLCFITSNKWMRAGYGEKAREFFATKTNPKLLIDFAGVKVFKSATVDTNILLFSKSGNEHKTICAVANKQNKSRVDNLSVFVEQENTVCDFSGGDSWVILSEIEQKIKRKIEAVGTPLKDWDIQINYGIKTGFNDAFIISTEKRDEILSKCQTRKERTRTEELIRPILRGRDIRRYGYDWANLWLIYIPWHFPYQFDESIIGASKKAESAFREQYPAVYAHMLKYKDPLTKRNRAETGIRYEWYAMQRWGANYWEDFNKPKIIWKRVGSILRFSYNDNGALGLDSTCFAFGENIEYVCCVLNSPMGHYLLKDAPKTGTGDLLVSVQAVEPICIPQIDETSNSSFKKALNLLIKNKKTDTLGKEIANKIFNLYGLSGDERVYITDNFS